MEIKTTAVVLILPTTIGQRIKTHTHTHIIAKNGCPPLQAAIEYQAAKAMYISICSSTPERHSSAMTCQWQHHKGTIWGQIRQPAAKSGPCSTTMLNCQTYLAAACDALLRHARGRSNPMQRQINASATKGRRKKKLGGGTEGKLIYIKELWSFY